MVDGLFRRGAVIFDLDGTLSDTSGDIAFSANHIRRTLGLPEMETAEVMALVGHGAPYLLSGLTGIENQSDDKFRALLDEYQAHYLRHQAEHSKLYPGIRALLERLKSDHYDLYILSNKPHPAVLEEVTRKGIDESFKAVWGAGALPELKPHPVGIERAMEMSGVSKAQTVMVGDMSPDIQVATNAGVHSCFVTWGFGTLTDEEALETHEVSTAEVLFSLIHQILEAKG